MAAFFEKNQRHQQPEVASPLYKAAALPSEPSSSARLERSLATPIQAARVAAASRNEPLERVRSALPNAPHTTEQRA